METGTTINLVLGLSVLGGFGLLLFYVIQQNFHTGKLIEAITKTIITVSDNQAAMDLSERLASQVIPVELANKIIETLGTGAVFAKAFTGDETDRLIDALDAMATKILDGQPNIPGTTTTSTTTTTTPPTDSDSDPTPIMPDGFPRG